MSAQLQEFTVKAETFRCQGRCGPRSCKGSHCLTSLTKEPPGGARKAPPFNGNEGLFFDTDHCHIKWIFLKESNGETKQLLFLHFSKQDRKCRRAPRAHFHNQIGGGGGTRGPWLNTHFGNVHEGNKLLEM